MITIMISSRPRPALSQAHSSARPPTSPLTRSLARLRLPARPPARPRPAHSQAHSPARPPACLPAYSPTRRPAGPPAHRPSHSPTPARVGEWASATQAGTVTQAEPRPGAWPPRSLAHPPKGRVPGPAHSTTRRPASPPARSLANSPARPPARRSPPPHSPARRARSLAHSPARPPRPARLPLAVTAAAAGQWADWHSLSHWAGLRVRLPRRTARCLA